MDGWMAGSAVVPTVTHGDLIQVVYMVLGMTTPVPLLGLYYPTLRCID